MITSTDFFSRYGSGQAAHIAKAAASALMPMNAPAPAGVNQLRNLRYVEMLAAITGRSDVSALHDQTLIAELIAAQAETLGQWAYQNALASLPCAQIVSLQTYGPFDVYQREVLPIGTRTEGMEQFQFVSLSAPIADGLSISEFGSMGTVRDEWLTAQDGPLSVQNLILSMVDGLGAKLRQIMATALGAASATAATGGTDAAGLAAGVAGLFGQGFAPAWVVANATDFVPLATAVHNSGIPGIQVACLPELASGSWYVLPETHTGNVLLGVLGDPGFVVGKASGLYRLRLDLAAGASVQAPVVKVSPA